MPHPFASTAVEPCLPLQLLLAPAGQISGDGQLRELMLERRLNHGSPDGGLWYLPPSLVTQLGHSPRCEALAVRDQAAAIWLQLRFGGQLQSVCLAEAWLAEQALALPSAAPLAALTRV